MNEDENKGIVFQIGYELPSQQRVSLQLANLRWHAGGVFSNVYRGTLVSPGAEREIAIKKTWPKTPERNLEVLFLSGIKRKPHKNVVQMLFAFARNTQSAQGSDTRSSYCESYVFEFMPTTLHSLLKSRDGKIIRMPEMEMKVYTWQLFEGLRYLQAHMIVHRDIKPVNLLIDPDKNVLKIADFGSAKIAQRGSPSSPYQVTRFYRPPELLLDANEYYWMVDVWSAGCCVGEMMKGNVLFMGATPNMMLKLFVQAFGLPTKRDQEYMKVTTMIDPVSDVKLLGLKQALGDVSQEWADFLAEILRYRPRDRLHGPKLLAHKFFDQIFADKCALSNGQLVSQVITREDYKTAIRNDCAAGKEYAAAVTKGVVKFSLKDVPAAPPIPTAPSASTTTATVPAPTNTTTPGKDSKDPPAPAPKVPSADAQQTLISPTAIMSAKRTMNV
ncbi:unnamed protein product [Caenorhabditis sp. 36 PRJEB53466]|nr:unnamed protein product [Caenorhabditis sp. 36 PRJEB53466]